MRQRRLGGIPHPYRAIVGNREDTEAIWSEGYSVHLFCLMVESTHEESMLYTYEVILISIETLGSQ